ncbi:MAG: 50S ribosomal protein L4 [Candidatus Zapsychrus exili]|nr:50S ribosomal protein L4 [Candidatus Zapsychrus exili]
MKFPVLDKNGKEKESIDLPDDIFNGKVNADVIHQAVVMYQASLRQGTASTKGRSCVSGGGRKPHRQKGTGRARVGSSRNPLWAGGGVVFGPHPRDFDYPLPKKIKKAALRESLCAKVIDKDLLCIVDLKEAFNKTKEFSKVLEKLDIKCKTLAVLDGSDLSIMKASRNIRGFNLMRACDVNAYDILKNKKLLLSKTAFNSLLDRIKK